jgi:electron transfer flavoprotein alpha subunit
VIALEDASGVDLAWSTPTASRLAALVEGEQPAIVLVGATPDGRDMAGALSALLGWGVLGNATEVAWAADGPTVEMSVFGGKLLTTSAFTADRGIVIVRPGSATAEPADTSGTVETVTATSAATLPTVAVLERVAETGAAAPIEEAKIIVAGGRGVGGSEGFAIVDELARLLGGVVGASRAAVDAGWIPYARQIGQTGKVVKPALYVALGISGAIQHKVGMQTAGTIVAVNRDPDAPLAEFADLYVVGDLFEVVPAILTELRARSD